MPSFRSSRNRRDIDVCELTWQQRIYDIRRTTGWSYRKLAVVSRIDWTTLYQIEKGKTEAQRNGRTYYPSIETIRKIRLIERAYDLELAQYRRDPQFYNRLPFRGTRKLREPFTNTIKHVHRIKRKVLPPLDLPRRPEDLEALGGIEVFRSPHRPTYKTERSPEQRREFALVCIHIDQARIKRNRRRLDRKMDELLQIVTQGIIPPPDPRRRRVFDYSPDGPGQSVA